MRNKYALVESAKGVTLGSKCEVVSKVMVIVDDDGRIYLPVDDLAKLAQYAIVNNIFSEKQVTAIEEMIEGTKARAAFEAAGLTLA